MDRHMKTQEVTLGRAACLAAWVLICASFACNPGAPSAGGLFPDDPPLVDLEGLKERIAAYRGKVVLLDFWATYCPPCIKAFPHVAELQRTLGPAGLQVLAVSLDQPEDWKKAVEILRAKKANFPCVVLEEAARDATVAYLSSRWRRELPAQFLVDRQGKVAGEFLVEATDDEVEEAVRKLLGEGSQRSTP
jgi:thiol-disulfide isomerase/thioredoxin